MCPTCKDWGADQLDPARFAIHCPDCKCPTYPNLGVNCPAGSNVAIAHAMALHHQLYHKADQDLIQLIKEAYCHAYYGPPRRT